MGRRGFLQITMGVVVGSGLAASLAACTNARASTSSSTPSASTSGTSGATAKPTTSAGTAAKPTTGAGGSQASTGGSGAQFTVNMTDQYKYEPPSLTVPKGATVTWKNTGTMVHTVTDDPTKALNKSDAVLPSGAEPFDSGILNAGQSWSHTFTTAGDYTYYCQPHETLGMIGKLTVQG